MKKLRGTRTTLFSSQKIPINTLKQMGIYFSRPLANLSILKISTTTNMQLIPNIYLLHLDIPTWNVLLAFQL